MSLHGSALVNGRSIGVDWSAQRVIGSPNLNDGICEYDCEVRYRGAVHHFRIEHRYDDGALVLASKVLAYACEYGTAGRR